MHLAHRIHALSGGRSGLQPLWQTVATSAQEAEPFPIVIKVAHISELLSCHYLGEGIADVLQHSGTSSHYFPCIARMSLSLACRARICNIQKMLLRMDGRYASVGLFTGVRFLPWILTLQWSCSSVLIIQKISTAHSWCWDLKIETEALAYKKNHCAGSDVVSR